MSVAPSILTALQRSLGGARDIDARGARFTGSPRHHAPPSPRLDPSRRGASYERSRYLAGRPSIDGARLILQWDDAKMPARAGRLTMTTTMKGAR
jgi:hypothetical protein